MVDERGALTFDRRDEGRPVRDQAGLLPVRRPPGPGRARPPRHPAGHRRRSAGSFVLELSDGVESRRFALDSPTRGSTSCPCSSSGCSTSRPAPSSSFWRAPITTSPARSGPGRSIRRGACAGGEGSVTVRATRPQGGASAPLRRGRLAASTGERRRRMKVLLLGNSSLARRRVLPALAQPRRARHRCRLGLPGRRRRACRPARRAPLLRRLPRGARAQRRRPRVRVDGQLHARGARRARPRGGFHVVGRQACLPLVRGLSPPRAARPQAGAVPRGGHRLRVSPALPRGPPDLRRRRPLAHAAHRRRSAFLLCRRTTTVTAPRSAADRCSISGRTRSPSGGVFLASAAPESIACRVVERAGEVESSFSVLMTFPGGRSMVGHYGMTTGYQNRLEVLGPDVVR